MPPQPAPLSEKVTPCHMRRKQQPHCREPADVFLFNVRCGGSKMTAAAVALKNICLLPLGF